MTPDSYPNSFRERIKAMQQELRDQQQWAAATYAEAYEEARVQIMIMRQMYADSDYPERAAR